MQTKQTPDVDCALVADMLTQYIETALWSTCDESNEDGSGGEPMDENYGPDDIDPKTLAEMQDDCSNFLTYVAEVAPDAYAELLTDITLAGHDFWLTRNGHGAGFWDGDWEHGDELTKASKTFGSVEMYVGDDGKIHA